MWQTNKTKQKNNLHSLPWMTSGVMSYHWSLTSFHPSDIAMNDWSCVMWMEALPPFISFDISMNDWICFRWMLQPYLFSFIWYIHECLESCHMDETIPFSPILHNHEWMTGIMSYIFETHHIFIHLTFKQWMTGVMSYGWKPSYFHPSDITSLDKKEKRENILRKWELTFRAAHFNLQCLFTLLF
jgi:hypothetical protein